MELSFNPLRCLRGVHRDSFSPDSGIKIISNGHNRLYFMPLVHERSSDSFNKLVTVCNVQGICQVMEQKFYVNQSNKTFSPA